MQDNNSGFGKAWKILTTQREVPKITIIFPLVIYVLLTVLVILSGQIGDRYHWVHTQFRLQLLRGHWHPLPISVWFIWSLTIRGSVSLSL